MKGKVIGSIPINGSRLRPSFVRASKSKARTAQVPVFEPFEQMDLVLRNYFAGELGLGTQAQDLLRIFQNEVNEKIQKVYCSCKEECGAGVGFWRRGL